MHVSCSCEAPDTQYAHQIAARIQVAPVMVHTKTSAPQKVVCIDATTPTHPPYLHSNLLRQLSSVEVHCTILTHICDKQRRGAVQWVGGATRLKHHKHAIIVGVDDLVAFNVVTLRAHCAKCLAANRTAKDVGSRVCDV